MEIRKIHESCIHCTPNVTYTIRIGIQFDQEHNGNINHMENIFFNFQPTPIFVYKLNKVAVFDSSFLRYAGL